MDASMLTARRRNRTLYINYETTPIDFREQNYTHRTHSVVSARLEGAVFHYEDTKTIVQPIVYSSLSDIPITEEIPVIPEKNTEVISETNIVETATTTVANMESDENPPVIPPKEAADTPTPTPTATSTQAPAVKKPKPAVKKPKPAVKRPKPATKRSTPAEPTPAESTPAEPTPAEPTPAEPTPAESTPAEPTPAAAKPKPKPKPKIKPNNNKKANKNAPKPPPLKPATPVPLHNNIIVPGDFITPSIPDTVENTIKPGVPVSTTKPVDIEVEPLEITLDEVPEDPEEYSPHTTADMYIRGTETMHDTGVSYSTKESPSNWYVNTLKTVVFTCLDEIIKTSIANRLTNTQTSRTMYLWFFTITSAYNWINESPKQKGTHDNWDWNRHYPLTKPRDIQLWIVHVLVHVMPQFIPSFDVDALLENERTMMRMTHEERTIEWMRISSEGNWNEWIAQWKTWYETRQADGSLYTNSTVDELPNRELFIDTAKTQDLSTLYEQTKWTPLIVDGKEFPYSTYNWGNVRRAALTEEDDIAILSVVAPLFPSDGKHDTEIAEIVALVANLTSEQKATSEFWLQTKMPMVCFFTLLWKAYLANVLTTDNIDTVFQSGLEMTTQMFEVGRCLWRFKLTNLQATPIQDVRRMYQGRMITSWNNSEEGIDGASWMPYYDPKLVTPACPDFPSEQSAFASIFAAVMTHWFQEDIPVFSAKTIPMISEEEQPFGTFLIRKGSSLIQPTVAPTDDIVLCWKSWKSMADSCGLAAKYSGIRTMSSHIAGQTLAKEVFERVRANWFA